MLHNIQESTQNDQSVKITVSLFVPRAMSYGTPTVKMTSVPGGTNPGSEQEFLLEVMIPAKVAVQAATQPPLKAPVPPAPAKGFVQEPLGPRTLAK